MPKALPPNKVLVVLKENNITKKIIELDKEIPVTVSLFLEKVGDERMLNKLIEKGFVKVVDRVEKAIYDVAKNIKWADILIKAMKEEGKDIDKILKIAEMLKEG
ncbi:MAG: hypothetical protein B6U95_01625 [Thermofilum sp. ex4484_82]|nr:MAG: hypothetical protein B6U95_01625 [Thermofilum sp. ex4484_82]OYT39596.1 MAG: hypothetical protein B6U96_01630 [Archaeoglobales archaeon ex4484_92]